MKRQVFLAALCLSAWAALAQDTNTTPAPAPEIVCDEPTYDFGNVDNSQDIEHVFVIKNAGATTLEIKNARPSCGCTVAQISEKMVAPGAETKITTKLSLRGRSGRQSKNITVESNDPQQPSLTLKLEGNVVVEVEVKPTELFFGSLVSDSTVTGVVDIIANSTNPVHVLSAESTLSNFISRIEMVSDGRLYKVHVGTSGTLPVGTLRGFVHIVTDHPQRPAFDVPVNAIVR